LNIVKSILLALIVVIASIEVYSLYDLSVKGSNNEQLEKQLDKQGQINGKIVRWSMASSTLLKSNAYDQSINEWLNSFDKMKSILNKSEYSFLKDTYQEEVFTDFSNLLFPLIRSRSRTGSDAISGAELNDILTVEENANGNLEKILSELESNMSESKQGDILVLYVSFLLQIILFAGYLIMNRDKTAKADGGIATSEVELKLKERVGFQNNAIEELKGMIEENVRTINLKDQEISETKKSLGEAQDKVEEYTKELRKVAKNLTKSQNEVKNFSQMIARDLKGPLKIISQLSNEIQSALLENEDVDQATKEKIRELLGQISDMEDVINGILEYASIGQKEVLQKVNTKEMVDELVRFFEPDPETKIVIHDDLPTLRTDNLALKQVLFNLVSNAVKFNRGQGSRVEIGCIEGPIYYKFWIMDNGPGIPKEDQERIFELFEKSENNPGSKKNAGVGLALVKKILTDKELEIWVNSQPGQGAKFTFTWKKVLA
jgi:signal transduction histidine kinase